MNPADHDSDGDGIEVQWDSTRPNFVQLPEWLLFHPDIGDGALRTWLALATWAVSSGSAYPSVRTLRDKRGAVNAAGVFEPLGERTIYRHLTQLETAGALRRVARSRANGSRTSTLYVLAWGGPLTGNHPPATIGRGVPAKRDRGTPATNDRGTPATNGRGAGANRGRARTRPTQEPHNSERHNHERDPLTPASVHTGADTGEVTSGGQAPPNPPRTVRRNSRADGTNPRAVTATTQAARDRHTHLAGARRFGTMIGSLDDHGYDSPAEFEQSLLDEARRHRQPADLDYISAAVDAFTTADASRTTAT